MIRCRGLMLQPRLTNSVASQSSSSGWVGGSPDRPKLEGLGTSPRPKCLSQTWFTMTREVSGCPGWVSQRARASRRPLESRPGFRGWTR